MSGKFREKGNAFYKSKEYEKALYCYSQAIQSLVYKEEKADLYNNRAVCFLQLKNYEDAIREASKCLSISDKNNKAYFRRCIAYEALGKIHEAYSDAAAMVPSEQDQTIINKTMDRLKKKLQKHLHSKNMSKSSDIMDLMDAIFRGNIAAAKVHIERGLHLNVMYDYETPLHIAVKKQNLEIVSLLLQNGSDVNHGNNKRETPLIYAVYADNAALVSLLIDHGANVNCRDNTRCPPLLLALNGGLPFTENGFLKRKKVNVEIVTLLLENGADANAQCSGMPYRQDNIPLFCAIENSANMSSDGYVTILSSLLKNGAHKSATLGVGIMGLHTTALDACISSGDISHDCQPPSLKVLSLLTQDACFGRAKKGRRRGDESDDDDEVYSDDDSDDYDDDDEDDDWDDDELPAHLMSPLGAMISNVELSSAHDVVAARLLTKHDIFSLPRYFARKVGRQWQRTQQFIEKEFSSVPSLELLSFVTISMAVTWGPHRTERVQQLCLPERFKNQLLAATAYQPLSTRKSGLSL